MVNVPYLEEMPMKRIDSIALFGMCCIYLTNAHGSACRETCDGGYTVALCCKGRAFQSGT